MVQIRISEQKKQEIISDYKNGLTLKELVIKYNRGIESIRYLLKKRGFKTINISEGHRKYEINENFFDKINTENKAYFLGLLYADGYNNRKTNTIRLQLQEKDKHILEKFNSLIFKNKPLSFIKKPKKTYSNSYRFEIGNKNISEKLEKYGCGQKKTFTIQFPTFLNNSLVRHFIRGYFDGDGHVSLNFKDPYISVISNTIFCKQLYTVLKKELDINISNFIFKKNINITTLQISGINQVLKFLDYLYLDSTVFLERKKERYLKIKEEVFKKSLPKKCIKCIICGEKQYAKQLCVIHYEKQRWEKRKLIINKK